MYCVTYWDEKGDQQRAWKLNLEDAKKYAKEKQGNSKN